MARTFSAEGEERLRLHADGVSRNEIAPQLEWSVGTITNHARRLGLSFDREAVRAATDARQVCLVHGYQWPGGWSRTSGHGGSGKLLPAHRPGRPPAWPTPKTCPTRKRSPAPPS